jgi:probable F420-dependent oxidoreductase
MAHDRRFRFGVMVPSTGSGDAFRETARKAEALGYSTLFVPDHFVDHPLAPMPALAVAAGVTTTLRVGPLVLGNDYKHPVVLAREAATLDMLSNGRLELGIGAGWMTVDYEKAGMTLDRPGVRIARLAESIAILKGLFADGECSFRGEHYTVTELDGRPKPVQRPHPPFIVGGGAPKMLGLAAREAQIIGINANLRSGDANSSDAANSLAPNPTDEKVQWIRDAAGDHFDDLEIQSLVGFVHFTEDRQGIAEAIGGGFGVSPDDALLAPVTLVGTESQMIELLHARRERWHMSYHVIPQEAMEQFAPVVSKLSGR